MRSCTGILEVEAIKKTRFQERKRIEAGMCYAVDKTETVFELEPRLRIRHRII